MARDTHEGPPEGDDDPIHVRVVDLKKSYGGNPILKSHWSIASRAFMYELAVTSKSVQSPPPGRVAAWISVVVPVNAASRPSNPSGLTAVSPLISSSVNFVRVALAGVSMSGFSRFFRRRRPR